jgi:hypothetical protein
MTNSRSPDQARLTGDRPDKGNNHTKNSSPASPSRAEAPAPVTVVTVESAVTPKLPELVGRLPVAVGVAFALSH